MERRRPCNAYTVVGISVHCLEPDGGVFWVWSEDRRDDLTLTSGIRVNTAR